jgi:hypothetical protein
MAFRIDDLIISVCDPEILSCRPRTHPKWQCSGTSSAYENLVPLSDDPSPEELAALKKQLRVEIRNIERKEREGGSRSEPGTVAEAVRLERALERALVEVQKIKTKLARRKKEPRRRKT